MQPESRPTEPAQKVPSAETESAAAVPRRTFRPIRSLGYKSLPAWVLSLVLHSLMLGVLTLASFATMNVPVVPTSFDASPFDTKVAPEEVVAMLADPSDDPTRTLAAASAPGDLTSTDAPSTTPVISETGKFNRPEDLTVDVTIPKLAMDFVTPRASEVLEGRTGFKGDVQPASEIGEALDLLSREILVRLGRQRVVVAWLFDESESMRDDQQAIIAKFDRVVGELGLRMNETAPSRGANEAEKDIADDNPKSRAARRKERAAVDPLRHIVVGFGEQFDLMQPPTADTKAISSAVNKLRVDTTGVENTFGAVSRTLQQFGSLSSSEQQLMVVIVTDESGDDFDGVENVLADCKRLRVPVFVIGRQAMFGTDRLQYRWVDPQTREVYWVTIRRGPETAAFETLQWDGLHPRREDQPSGFAPYDLARLTKETGGRYFILPTIENERVRQIEKAYSFNEIRELAPDYEGRIPYLSRRNASRLRSTMAEIIRITSEFSLREEFPVNPDELLPLLIESGTQAMQRANVCADLEKRLRALEKDRDRDPERRWQANYDLMLAQLVASQVKLVEYSTLIDGWIAAIRAGKPPVPAMTPSTDRIVLWHVRHSGKHQTKPEFHDPRNAVAKAQFEKVIEKYPNSPWADLSRLCLERGFSVQRDEIYRSPLYQERARFVPKF